MNNPGNAILKLQLASGTSIDILMAKSYVGNQGSYSLSNNYCLELTTLNSLQPNWLGQTASLIRHGYDQWAIHGFITRINTAALQTQQLNQLYLQSPLYPLTLNRRQHCYQGNVPALIEQILQTWGWNEPDYQLLLKSNYPNLPYVVQYQESDYQFLQRLLAKWGIFYCFKQYPERAQLLISDDIAILTQQWPITYLPYQNPTGLMAGQTSIWDISCRYRSLSENIILQDYDYHAAQPMPVLISEKNSNIAGFGCDYRYGEHFTSTNQGHALLQIRQQALDCRRELITAQSDAYYLQAGMTISITGHPLPWLNDNYYLTDIDFSLRNQQNSHHITDYPDWHGRLQLTRAHLAFRPEPPPPLSMPDQAAQIISLDDSDQPAVDSHGYYYIRPAFLAPEVSTQCHHSVPLASPYSGQGYGWHFPLLAGTAVQLTHLNGDPDRPVILGVLNNINNPGPVTALNRSQQLLRTPAGHQLLIEDQLGTTGIFLTTPQQQQQIILADSDNSNKIAVINQQGDIICEAGQAINSQSQASQYYQVGKTQQIVAGQQLTQTQQGDLTFTAQQAICLTALQDITWQAQNDCCWQAKQTLINATQAIELTAKELQLTASTGNVVLQAGQDLTLLSESGQFSISQAGAHILFTEQGITINAPSCHIMAEAVNFTGNPVQLGGSSTTTTTDSSSLSLLWQNEIGQAYQSTGSFYQLLPHSVSTTWTGAISNQVMAHPGLDPQASYQLQTQAPIIAVNDQAQIPHNKTTIKPSAASSATSTTVKILSPPIIVNLRNDSLHSDRNSYAYRLRQSQLLTNAELNYFRQRGNNVTLFIHGYNTPYGKFSAMLEQHHYVNLAGQTLPSSTEPAAPWDSLAAPLQDDTAFELIFTGSSDCTYYRDLASLRQLLPDLPNNIEKINGTTHWDNALNGTGFHNWLIHLEDNCNRATGQFQRQDYRLFERLLGIAWSGDPTDPLDYIAAVAQIHKAGLKLATLIQQLATAGLKINIIAHSLGGGVLLQAMNELGRSGNSCIEYATLWQVAVPADVFVKNQPNYLGDPWYLPHALQAANKIIVIWSHNDNILGPIPAVPMPGTNQTIINQHKPVRELVPAIIISSLQLGSIYNIAMWAGVSISDLFNQQQLEKTYQQFIQQHPIANDGHVFNKDFNAEILYNAEQNPGLFTVMRNKVQAIQPSIQAQIHAVYGTTGNVIEWLSKELLFGGIDLVHYVIPTVLLFEAPFAEQFYLNKVQAMLTLLNIFFVQTDYQPPIAMGYAGPLGLEQLPSQLRNKLILLDYSQWLWHHAALLIPNDAVMTHCYQEGLFKQAGMRFGNYQPC